MPQGTIKKILGDKGFGFISDGRNDLFFHQSAVASGAFETLRVGQPVTFEVDDNQGGKGPRAINVKAGTDE